MKKLFISLFLCLTFMSFAQEEVIEFDNWVVKSVQDPMTDAYSFYAFCFNKEPRYASFNLALGIQFENSTIVNIALCTFGTTWTDNPVKDKTFEVTYRVDKNTPISSKWTTSANGKELSLTAKDIETITSQMVEGSKVAIRVFLNKTTYVDIIFEIGGYSDVPVYINSVLNPV